MAPKRRASPPKSSAKRRKTNDVEAAKEAKPVVDAVVEASIDQPQALGVRKPAAAAAAAAASVEATAEAEANPNPNREDNTLDAKCGAFWNAMRHPISFTKSKLTKLRAKMSKAFATPCKYSSANKKHKYAYLKSLLPCITRGCVRNKDDIQCQRCDYLEERYLRSTSLGDETEDLWGFLMDGLPSDKFTYAEAVYLLHIAVRHAGLHGGEWDAATRTEAIHLYPTKYMAKEAIALLRVLPKDCMAASAKKFADKSDACIQKRAEMDKAPEKSTRRTAGTYHGCSKCDTQGTKLNKRTRLTLCCNAQPDGFSYEVK